MKQAHKKRPPRAMTPKSRIKDANFVRSEIYTGLPPEGADVKYSKTAILYYF